MLKFAQVEYLKDEKELWVNEFVLRLPKWLREPYFLCFVPLKVENISMGNTKGIKIILPITSYEDNAELCTRMIRKLVSLLMDKEIEIVINEDRIPLPNNFVQARGSRVISYFISHIFKDACNSHGIDVAEAKVVVIDGKNLETFLVLHGLMGEVNHLSIRTDNKAALEETTDKIYEESGLVMEFFVSPRSSYMKGADIIINCNDDMENFDYIFKKGAVYIEASAFKGKLNRLRQRREDMHFYTNLYTEVCGERLNAAHAEALFLIKWGKMDKGSIMSCEEYGNWEFLQELKGFSLES